MGIFMAPKVSPEKSAKSSGYVLGGDELPFPHSFQRILSLSVTFDVLTIISLIVDSSD
jgi:hypothetical protein